MDNLFEEAVRDLKYSRTKNGRWLLTSKLQTQLRYCMLFILEEGILATVIK